MLAKLVAPVEVDVSHIAAQQLSKSAYTPAIPVGGPGAGCMHPCWWRWWWQSAGGSWLADGSSRHMLLAVPFQVGQAKWVCLSPNNQLQTDTVKPWDADVRHVELCCGEPAGWQ